ncbi:hypothetical protein ACFSTC_47740 [Nonomuraea ferruginea]
MDEQEWQQEYAMLALRLNRHLNGAGLVYRGARPSGASGHRRSRSGRPAT